MWVTVILLLLLGTPYLLAQHHATSAYLQDAPWQLSPRKTERFTVQFRSNVNDRTAAVAEQENFLRYLEQHGINVTVRYRFNNVMNGMSIHLNEPQASFHAASAQDAPKAEPLLFLRDTLGSCPYVRRYWPGRRYKRPQVERSVARSFVSVSENDTAPPIEPGLANLQAAHSMTGVDRAWLDGIDGSGIKIGLIDTGVDYTHPSLGGCFGDGCLVAYGYDFVGDDFGSDQQTMPDPDPLDTCDGHGTHVAGIIAANDSLKQFQGVAPGVTLGAWRVFGCQDDTDDDIILAAAEMATVAGMDIINLSLGSGVSAWQEDPLSVALSNIVKRGIIVVAAQGNEGRDGISRTPSPAIGTHVMAVGSVDNLVSEKPVFSIYKGQSKLDTFGYVAWKGKSFVPDDLQMPFTVLSSTFDAAANTSVPDPGKACDPIMQDVSGQVVFVKRGACDFGQKAMQVQNARGIGMMVYSDPGDSAVSIDLNDYSRIHIPVGSISGSVGAALLAISSVDETYSVSFSSELLPVATGGAMSVFSTWGPDPELHLKPDIVGVGGFIYSTYPVELGSYAMLSGTSMATPYIAGCIALYMQATGQRSPKAIFGALQNQAKPVSVFPTELNELSESPVRQGPGLVQIYDAITSKTLVEPFKIALNDTSHFVNCTVLIIHNRSNDTKSYRISHKPAAALSGYDFTVSAVPLARPKYMTANATIHLSNETITVPGQHSARLKVTFEQPEEPTDAEHVLYGGHIEITELGQELLKQRIPYFGALGDQYNLPLLDRKQGFPFIGDRIGELHRGDQAVRVYHFSRGDVLRLLYRLGSPTSQIKLELLDAQNTVIGTLPYANDHYLSRNDHSIGEYSYSYNWRGRIVGQDRLVTQYVTSGRYKIRISVLRIFGDPSQDNDWDVWDSPEFVVV